MRAPTLLLVVMATLHVQAQILTEYRYWLNDDPSQVQTVPVTAGTELDLMTVVDLPSLQAEYNRITFQFKDDNNYYSSPITKLFSRSSGPVNGYEYWIDDAIDDRTSNTIGPDMQVDLMADLPTGTVDGMHSFTIRFSSENGTWSVPLVGSFSFFTNIEELPGVSQLVLFPNPVEQQLQLEFNAQDMIRLDLRILDGQGRVIRSDVQEEVYGNTRRSWDVSGLAAGTYVLWIGSDHGRASIPFVKH